MNPLDMFYIILGTKRGKNKKNWFGNIAMLYYSIYSFILAKFMHFEAFFMLK